MRPNQRVLACPRRLELTVTDRNPSVLDKSITGSGAILVEYRVVMSTTVLKTTFCGITLCG